MNRDKEIYGVANVCIREHGEDAVIEAAMRADALLEVGDLDGRNVWLRVIEAIRVLLTRSGLRGALFTRNGWDRVS